MPDKSNDPDTLFTPCPSVLRYSKIQRFTDTGYRESRFQYGKKTNPGM